MLQVIKTKTMKKILFIILIFYSSNILSQKISVDNQGNINMIVSLNESLVFENGETINLLAPYPFEYYYENVLFQISRNGELNWYVHFAPSGYYGECFQDIDILTDNNDNIYFLATFYGSIEFNEITINSEDGNTCIIKFDQFGNLLWLKQSTGDATFYNANLSLDSLNNIYFTGLYYYDYTFGGNDTLTSPYYDEKIFIAKFDKDGNNNWLKNVTGNAYVAGISTDNDGKSYIIGAYNENIYFGNLSILSSNSWDIFIASCDTNGDPISLISIGGDENDTGRRITTNGNSVSFSVSTASNLIYINDTVQIYPNTPPSYYMSSIVLNYNIGLDSLNWFFQMDSVFHQDHQIEFDNEGNTIFQGGVYIDQQRVNSYNINGTGDLNCLHRIFCNTPDNDLDVIDNISYISGSFYNSIDFGNNNIYYGDNRNYYIAKFDINCNLIWVYIIGNHYTSIDEISYFNP